MERAQGEPRHFQLGPIDISRGPFSFNVIHANGSIAVDSKLNDAKMATRSLQSLDAMENN